MILVEILNLQVNALLGRSENPMTNGNSCIKTMQKPLTSHVTCACVFQYCAAGCDGISFYFTFFFVWVMEWAAAAVAVEILLSQVSASVAEMQC